MKLTTFNETLPDDGFTRIGIESATKKWRLRSGWISGHITNMFFCGWLHSTTGSGIYQKQFRVWRLAVSYYAKILLLTLCLNVSAQSSMERQIWALKQLENGSNRHCGPSGELGETQIMPYRLRECKIPIPARIQAKWVSDATAVILVRSCACFDRIHHRWPTDYETGLIWHCPGAIRNPNAERRDFATRFSNLCSKPLAKP